MSLLAGLTAFGGLASAATPLGRDRARPPVATRRENWVGSLVVLLYYVAIPLGITVGWRQTHTVGGVVVGCCVAMSSAFVLGLVIVIADTVVLARRHRSPS